MYLKKSKATYKVYKKKIMKILLIRLKLGMHRIFGKYPVSGIIHHSFTIQMDSKILVSG